MSARENKEAEYFWSCVRQRTHSRDPTAAGYAPLAVSLKVSLASPLGLAFDSSDLRLLEVGGQGMALLKDAAVAAAKAAGLPVPDDDDDDDDDDMDSGVIEEDTLKNKNMNNNVLTGRGGGGGVTDRRGGEWQVPVGSWGIKSVGGNPVSDGAGFVAALERCRGRGETHAFVQLAERGAPGESAKQMSAAPGAPGAPV